MIEQYIKDNSQLIKLISSKLKRKWKRVFSPEEVDQYVLLGVWKAFTHPKNYTMGTLIDRYANYLMLYEYSQMKKHNRADIFHNNVYIDTSSKTTDDKDYVDYLLNSLDPRDRAIVNAYFLQHKSIASIANKLNLRTDQVDYLKSSAIKKMKKYADQNQPIL